MSGPVPAGDVAAAVARHLSGDMDAATLERWAEERESPAIADEAVRDALAFLARPPSCGPARREALERLAARLRGEG